MRAWIAIVAALASGCGDEPVVGPNDMPPATAAPGAPAASASVAASASASPALPVVQFTEADFVESDDARDPFRDFRHVFLRKDSGDRAVQRNVKAAQYALDELKLVGIITRSTQLVMLQDPTGFAWTVTTGEYVGKTELVRAGGADSQEVAMNWRVDRIRPTDVVFIRDDSAHPDIPPTTRVIPLYPDESTRPGG